MSDINARMEALCRRISERWTVDSDGRDFATVAGGIIRDLDRERDPDIVDAERIARSHCGANVAAVLNGIKHGRDLAEAARQSPLPTQTG